MSDPLYVAGGLEFSALVTGERTVVGLQITHSNSRNRNHLQLDKLRELCAFLESILEDAPGERLKDAKPGKLTSNAGARAAAAETRETEWMNRTHEEKQRRKAAESALASARALPSAWRELYPENTALAYGAAGIRWCADELDKALSGKL